MDGKLYFCIDFLHVKPGKGNTIMRTTLKDVVSGRVLEKRFNIGEALEDVRVERRPYQFLYMEGSDYIFMNQETFDQIPIARDLITGVDYMKESDVVEVVSDADTETILFAEMPVKTNLRITHSEPGVKGDTATNATKPATLETGVEVRVPLFINEGDLIQVDTRFRCITAPTRWQSCSRALPRRAAATLRLSSLKTVRRLTAATCAAATRTAST